MSYVNLHQEELDQQTDSEVWETMLNELEHAKSGSRYSEIYYENAELCVLELAKRITLKNNNR